MQPQTLGWCMGGIRQWKRRRSRRVCQRRASPTLCLRCRVGTVRKRRRRIRKGRRLP
jgi:hypothetical protein